jgi:hypothetical protein
MYELKKNLLGPGPRLTKKEFTGPWSHKGWDTLYQMKKARVLRMCKSLLDNISVPTRVCNQRQSFFFLITAKNYSK